MAYQTTRKQIIDAAKSCAGIRFVHQGRSESGVDCVGLLVLVGKKINYPEIFDVQGYRRVPSADTIRETLRKNCDEIPIASALPGDIFLMRMGGVKPRHAAIYLGDRWSEQEDDPNPEPCIIHAVAPVVKIQPLSDFPKEWFVAGFRIRNIAEEQN